MNSARQGVNYRTFICELAFALTYVFTVIYGYDLTILHTNDVHSRFEQFNRYGAECSSEEALEGNCYGGVARRYTKVQELREKHDNVVLLDAGDQFMGSTWFEVHRGMATAFFMNHLKYDVMCLGNHEFDNGVDGLVKFLYNVSFSVVSANTDVGDAPRLQGRFSKSIFLAIGGEKVGIIGYVTQETSEISTPGPTISFHDVLESVRKEVILLQNQGINKIIALGHAGFNMDKQVATIDGIDLVVGGHTSTFLYNGYQPSDEKIDGPYPFVVHQPAGNKALVVQAYTKGKYLGYLNLVFDSKGIVTNYSGQPILLGSSVQEDGVTLSHISEWKKPVDAISSEPIGFSKVFLDGKREHCRLQECNLGNLVTDAIVEFHLNHSHVPTQWAPAAIALWNGEGIRTSIDKGIVTTGEAIPVMPFGNTVDIVTVKGKNLRDQLEHSVQKLDKNEPHGRFLQMSGLRVLYDMQQPVGQRVVSVEAKCLECDVPSYSPLVDTDEYKIFLSTFLLNGGDGYNFESLRRLRFNTLDLTTFIEYFKRNNPVVATVEGRIRFHEEKTSSTPLLYAQPLLLFLSLTAYKLL